MALATSTWVERLPPLVELSNADDELAHGLSMHVAANSPSYILETDIPAADYDHEKHIQIELAKKDPKLADKTNEMLEKNLGWKKSKNTLVT